MHNSTCLPDETITEINENLSLIQKKNGLCFGTDAYLLSAFVRPHTTGFGADFGAGSGVISLLLARRHARVTMYAVELQEMYGSADGVIARNAARNGLGERVLPLCADVRTLSAKTFGRELDFVVSNPPYMSASGGRKNEAEEKYLARHAANGEIEDFCNAAARALRFGGLFYVVYRPDRLTDLICALRAAHLEPKRIRFVAQDTEHAPSMVLVEAKKGARASLVLSEMLFLQQNGEMHPRVREIYDGGFLT